MFGGLFCNFAIMAKGRNKQLIDERDKKLFERFYYWSEVQRLRFDDVIRKLSEEEFFLSEATTLRIIKRMLVEGATVNGTAVHGLQVFTTTDSFCRSTVLVSRVASLTAQV